MKEMRNWMRAAILTLCGTITFTMTSCSADDNTTSVQQPELSSYTVEQLKTYARGAWLDEIQFTDDAAVRLYDINDDGHCDVYDFSFEEESEDEEDLGSYVTYNGTWSVTNDLSKLHFVDQLNLNDFELIGGLLLQVKKEVDENDETYKVFKENGFDLNAEKKDTLAMLRNKATGDMTFISHTDADLLALLIETDQFSDVAETRGTTRARNLSIEERIKLMISDNELTLNKLQKVNNKKIDNADYIGRYYKGLNPRICDMSILGAGGAATTYLTKDLGKEKLSDYKRQYLTIRQLWNLGVRYFDLGTIYKGDNDRIYFYDEDMKFIYPGVKPDMIFQELSDLLKEHPSEIAIIMLDQAPKLDNKTMQDVSLSIYNDLKEVLGIDRIAVNYGPDLRLNDCRGRIIVMNNYETPWADIARGACMHNVWSEDVKTGEIEFPGGAKAKGTVQAYNTVPLLSSTLKTNKIENALQIANESAKSSEPHWVVNHVAGRFGIPGMMIHYSVNASLQNEEVAKVLLNRKYAKTGIVVVDFIGIDQQDNDMFPNNPKGVDLIAPIIGANYYASKNHLISLDEYDVVK